MFRLHYWFNSNTGNIISFFQFSFQFFISNPIIMMGVFYLYGGYDGTNRLTYIKFMYCLPGYTNFLYDFSNIILFLEKSFLSLYYTNEVNITLKKTTKILNDLIFRKKFTTFVR